MAGFGEHGVLQPTVVRRPVSVALADAYRVAGMYRQGPSRTTGTSVTTYRIATPPVTLRRATGDGRWRQTRIGISTYSAFASSFSRISVGADASARCTSTRSLPTWPKMSSR